MLELEFGGQRYTIPAGELVVGSDPSAQVFLPGILPRHAILLGAPDGAASVRPASPDAEVLLNGVKLGAEPAPILHGDKIQLGSREFLVTDPRRSGSTQFVNSSDVAKMVSQSKSGGKPATAATGGRLVCLTDGREYTMGSAPIVFGREAGCDIVVPNKDVSRRHAEILATPQGYLLIDSSTNGTFVNGDRIEMQRVLARADVIRVGDHDFRFYADAAAEPPRADDAPPLAPAPAEPAIAAPPAPPPAPVIPEPVAPAAVIPAPEPPAPEPVIPEGAGHRLSHTMHSMPVTAPGTPALPTTSAQASAAAAATPRSSGAVPPLASLLVRSGSLKGSRLPIRVPVVNIGRAEYNDIVIPDESVSTMHAKLQRREQLWVLTDNSSTNGTFVDGERVTSEAVLSPGALVRFGETAVMFEPTDTESEVKKGSGTKVMGAVNVPVAPTPMPVADRPPPSEPLVPAPKPPLRRPVVVASPRSKGFPGWVIPVVVVVILAVVAAFLLSK